MNLEARCEQGLGVAKGPAAACILAIESSCDETAAAVVTEAGEVLSSVVASQLEVHEVYGGVVPELASREHLRNMVPVVREAMARAGFRYEELAAVAVTNGPGLMGALLVGVTYAKGICLAAGLPLIGVNHLEGHVHAVVLESQQQHQEIALPALALIVSGGHTHLYLATAEGYRLLGRTRDDAIGEAFDKIGVTLGFPYPAGPILDTLAAHGRPQREPFTVPAMKGNPLDFSFSGYKTAALRWVQQQNVEAEIARRRAWASGQARPRVEDWLTVTPQATLDLIASFQKTAIDHLEANILAALRENEARALIVSGGVACNRGLRARLHGQGFPLPVYFPTPSLSTDNAVMIAAAAFPKWRRGECSDLRLEARASAPLEASGGRLPVAG